ncbi:MAG: ABC transporter substrate-binding protein, partial [Betaproteobacteria bacterium]|nr:ABC transporter substrate-binding protein [Betaproteobacteria bacterium]
VVMASQWLMLSSSHAQSPADPRALVERTVTEVLALAASDPGVAKGDLAGLTHLVEARIVPHFDFATMTRLAVGRHWRAASAGQRNALVAQFQRLLVRTYTRAYARSRNVRARVSPLQLERGATEATVKTVLMLPGEAPDVTVDYDMHWVEGRWKVYNVTVEGVSLVTTYRGEFAEQIREAGVDGFLRRLEEKNRSP